MKRWAAVAGAAFILGMAILGWGWFMWTGPGPQAEPSGQSAGQGATIQLRIPQGMTLAAAADSLAAVGLLKHPSVFLLGARLTGKARALRAGLYDLPRAASPRELLWVVTSGNAVQVKVTIPEGLDSESVADLLADRLGISRDEFLAVADSLVIAAAEQGTLLRSGLTVADHDSLLAGESARHPRRFRWCEGHLAPDTFFFAEGTDAATVAQFLVLTQWARLDSVMVGSPVTADLKLARQDLLTLASIVEAEARLDEERPLIAAVYVNRMRQGWRLEADPTVAFILKKKGKRLYYRDLEVDSAFNTYRNKGLPPGPIGVPGLAAIEAAARPDSTCRALYFVSDVQGGHVFSRTAREHEAAVQEFRRARARENGKRND